MEEIEVPLEGAQEDLHHAAVHSGVSWISGVALSSALLAVMAAIAALLAGHAANEAMIEQIQASNHWSYYQAKSIKSSLLTSKTDIFQALGKTVADADKEKQKEYKKQMAEISAEAKEKEASAAVHLHRHEVYAKAVTFFQVAIAVSAIAALTKKKHFWWGGLAAGVMGLIFLIQGFFFS